MSEQKSLKEIIREEYLKCANDPIYFLKRYVYIQTSEGRVLFIPFQFQEKLLYLLNKHDRTLILKSRQLGITTLSAAYSLWLMTFKKDQSILALAPTQEKARNIVDKVRFAYSNLPSWLRVPAVEDNKLSLILNNGSRIKAASGASESARGYTANVLVLDEAAFIENAEDLWGSAQQTLATGGRAIVLSCVVGETYVYTDKGVKKIENFYKDPNVEKDYEIPEYSILGKDILRSGNLFHNNGKTPTKVINSTYAYLEGSYNHKVYAYSSRDCKFDWYKLEDLSEGDYTAVQYGMDVWGSNDDVSTFAPSKSPKIKNHFSPKMIDKSIAYLIGLYISEGSSYINKNANGDVIGGNITITCGDDMSKFILDVGLPYSSHDKLHYTISSKNLVEFFQYIGFDLGKIAKEKVIPERVLEMSRENIISMLKGIFDGDGSVMRKEDGLRVSIGLSSKELVLQIRVLLMNLGILSTYQEVATKITKKVKVSSDSYRLDISDRHARKFCDIVGFNLDRKVKVYEAYDLKLNKRGGVYDIIPGYKEVFLKIKNNSKLGVHTLDKYTGLSLSKIVSKEKSVNMSRGNALIIGEKLSAYFDEDVKNFYKDNVSENIAWSKITSIQDSVNYTYDFSLPDTEDKWCHSVIYNGIVGHQTPNGVGQWFHQQWVDAEAEDNNFVPIRLPWNVHPSRNQKWREDQDKELGKRMAAQECFEGDTRIYTNKGLKKISDIKIGDEVLTHLGRYRKVVSIMTHDSSNLYSVKSSINSINRKVTKNHPFFYKKEWVKIDDIPNKAILPSFFSHITINSNQNEIDLSDMIKPIHFKLITEDFEIYVNDRKHKTRFPRRISLDYKFGLLIGLYMAEGSKSTNRITFSFGYKKELNTWPADIADIVLDRYKIKGIVRKKRGNSADVDFCSQILSSVISLFVEGDDCYSKRLSEYAYANMNKDMALGIIDGLYKGDGCLLEKYKKTLSTTSEDLAYDCLYLLKVLGVEGVYISMSKGGKEAFFPGRDRGYISATSYQITIGNTAKVPCKSGNISSLLYNRKKVKPSKEQVCGDYTYNTVIKEDITELTTVYNFEVEEDHTYVTEHFIVHNCDCSFLSSGDTYFESEDLQYYSERTREPIESRGPHKDYWIWEYPTLDKSYMVVVDTAKGDGSDSSVVQVIDVFTGSQVAEYRGDMDTKSLSKFAVSVATEYNTALLVVENTGLGHATISDVLEIGYSNIYYSPKGDTLNVSSYITQYYDYDTSKMTPGFTTSTKTRPEVLLALKSYVRDHSISLNSRRLASEMSTFIWKNSKPQAQSGYHDDCVMAYAIGMFLRDSAVHYRARGVDMQKALIQNMSRGSGYANNNTVTNPYDRNFQNPYQLNVNGQQEDISWLIR